MCSSVATWLNNNPLRLGIDDDSLTIITSQLKRGNVTNCSEAIRRKAWLHIDVEFDGVPGNPMEKFREMAEGAGLKSPGADGWSPRTQLSQSSQQLSGKLQTLISSASAGGGGMSAPNETSDSREQQEDVSDALTALMKSTSVRDNKVPVLLTTDDSEPAEEEEATSGVEEDATDDDTQAEKTNKESVAESNNRRLSQIFGPDHGKETSKSTTITKKDSKVTGR
jgi:hypothetical protein